MTAGQIEDGIRRWRKIHEMLIGQYHRHGESPAPPNRIYPIYWWLGITREQYDHHIREDKQ